MPTCDELEHRLVAQRVVIVAVLVASEDAVEPLPCHLHVRVLGVASPIDQAVGQPLCVAPPFVELPDGQQPRVTADRLILRLDNDGLLWEKMELKLIHRLLRHHAASVRFELWSVNRVRTHEGRFFKSGVNDSG